MILYQEVCYSNPIPCSYLPDKIATQAYFYAGDLDEFELDLLLATGWRKFGFLFFRPVCVMCRKCTPIRIPVHDLILSKSQRRLIRKNRDTVVSFGPLQYSDELYSMYEEHSKDRFSNGTSSKEFKNNLCTSACPSLMSKYYVNDILAGTGFIDRSSTSINSVYFIFKTEFESLGLGNYGVLREIQFARDEGLLYYYLGYYIEGCSTMEYKSHFFPNERFNWKLERWELVTQNLYHRKS